MKILTKEEEEAHYQATLKGGSIGGLVGTAAGFLGVAGARRRFPAFRGLTLPLQAFLITSTGTFAAIISADHYSRAFERSRHPDRDYVDQEQSLAEQSRSLRSGTERTKDWLSENRYAIVFGSWVASMGVALGLVGRNPYLSGQQKLVQARVYAQGLTLAVVIISLAFETNDSRKGKGRWETVRVLDPNDPEHKKTIEKKIHHEAYAGEDQWRDMIEAEEQRMKQREKAAKQHEVREKKLHPKQESKEKKRREGKKGKDDEQKEKKDD